MVTDVCRFSDLFHFGLNYMLHVLIIIFINCSNDDCILILPD